MLYYYDMFVFFLYAINVLYCIIFCAVNFFSNKKNSSENNGRELQVVNKYLIKLVELLRIMLTLSNIRCIICF